MSELLKSIRGSIYAATEYVDSITTISYGKSENPSLPDLTSNDEIAIFLSQLVSQRSWNAVMHHKRIDRAMAKLEEFEALEPNWDSYDASPIRMDCIEEARTLIRSIMDDARFSENNIEFYPIPTVSGGVALYFEFEQRELRVKISPEYISYKLVAVDKSSEKSYMYYEYAYSQEQTLMRINWLTQNQFSVTKTYSTSESAQTISIQTGTSRSKLSHQESRLIRLPEMTAEENQWIGTDIPHQLTPSKGIIVQV